MSAAAHAHLAKIPALDGLRGLAILLVLPHNLRRIAEPHDAWSLLWVQVADRGWIGVQLFFVLSGFLITRILLDTQSESNYYSGFYARRALRILPLYYAALGVWLVLLPLLGWGTPHNTNYDAYFWLLLSNYVHPFHPGSGGGLGHIWSLAVEEQFYLLWPPLLRPFRPRGVLTLCGILVVLSVSLRFVMLQAGWPTTAVYEFTPCRMDALALGGAVAAALAIPDLRARLAVRRLTWIRWSPLVLFVAGAALSRGYRQTGFMAMTLGYFLLAAAAGCWILSIALGTADGGHGWLEWDVLRKAGKYSYGMYVIHVPFGLLWAKGLAAAGWSGRFSVTGDLLQTAAAMTAVFALAVLSYRWLESPFLRLKDRFAPRLTATGFGNRSSAAHS